MIQKPPLITPARLLVISFVVMIFIGTIALLLPGITSFQGPVLSFGEALFTSTSAVCVTGLIVRDTAIDLSFRGQFVILILIQIGGIGILTFSNILISSGKKMRFSKKLILEASYGTLPTLSISSLIRILFKYVAAVEFLGAAILTSRFFFTYHMNLSEAIWLGTFHSVSAFCNAGFSVFSDSLIGYSSDWVINLTIILLIIAGGIGFFVSADLKRWVMSRKKKVTSYLTLHTRIVLFSTCLLIVIPTVLFYILELTGHAMPESMTGHLLDSLFLSVTARTAGFNTVEMSQLTNPTLIIMMILMFIGGSPASTAGGVKTTTFCVLIVLTISKIKNRKRSELFNRSLPEETVAKALATIISFILIIMLCVVILQVTELYGEPHAVHRGKFLEYMFEVVSAICTVGLSTGITGELSSYGRIVIMFCMFAGRLGPLLLVNSIVGKKKQLNYSYAEENIIIG